MSTLTVRRLRPCPSCQKGMRTRAGLVVRQLQERQSGYVQAKLLEAMKKITELRIVRQGCEDCDGEGQFQQELEVELAGTFVKGYPETGPSYASGGEQGMPDMFEDIKATWHNADTDEDESIELSELEETEAEEQLMQDRG